uniref:Uncharacterized protein B12F1.085 n=1 Tax=Neurospora crassa TaxID=5141 RepID=Q96U87_NEUCS|nr:hypothetical protein [Neurospora crassa]
MTDRSTRYAGSELKHKPACAFFPHRRCRCIIRDCVNFTQSIVEPILEPWFTQMFTRRKVARGSGFTSLFDPTSHLIKNDEVTLLDPYSIRHQHRKPLQPKQQTPTSQFLKSNISARRRNHFHTFQQAKWKLALALTLLFVAVTLAAPAAKANPEASKRSKPVTLAEPLVPASTASASALSATR